MQFFSAVQIVSVLKKEKNIPTTNNKIKKKARTHTQIQIGFAKARSVLNMKQR